MNIFDDLNENLSESINDHELKTMIVLEDNYNQAVLKSELLAHEERGY